MALPACRNVIRRSNGISFKLLGIMLLACNSHDTTGMDKHFQVYEFVATLNLQFQVAGSSLVFVE